MVVGKINNKSIEKLGDFINKLDYYKKAISETDYTHERNKYFSLIVEFREFLANQKNKKLCFDFFHSEYYSIYKDFFRNHNQYYMRSLECLEVTSILSKQSINLNNLEIFISLINSDYLRERYIKKSQELKLADFSSAEEIVIIGCGSFPESIIYVYENTNIKRIIGLDDSEEAVYIGGKLLSLLLNGMKNSSKNIDIKYTNGNGIEYDYSNADIIYATGYSYPKKDIIKKIADTCKYNSQIIVDSPTFMSGIIFDSIKDSIDTRLKVIDKADNSNPYYNGETLKLKKYNL